MKYEIVDVTLKDKEKLYKLLQFVLYDGSQYIDNDINDNLVFEYNWFDNYFTYNDRNAYFIKSDNKYLGMVMVNENLKFNNKGKCVAEFLIMPNIEDIILVRRLLMIYLENLKVIGKFNQWKIIQ